VEVLMMQIALVSKWLKSQGQGWYSLGGVRVLFGP